MNFCFADVEKENKLFSENLSPKKLGEERGEKTGLSYVV